MGEVCRPLPGLRTGLHRVQRGRRARCLPHPGDRRGDHGLAIWLQLAAEPPFWVHVVLWVPLTAAAVVGGLRGTKAWLLQAEYRRKASEAVNTEWTLGEGE